MRTAILAGAAFALAGCLGGGADQPQGEVATQLSFEQLMDLTDVIVDIEQSLPTDPDHGDTIGTTAADVVGMGTVNYAGVTIYGELDDGTDGFDASYLSFGELNLAVDFDDGAIDGAATNFYEVSNLDEYNASFAAGNTEDVTLASGGAIAGTLTWEATFQESFGTLITRDDGNRLTGTLTKLDGSMVTVDMPIYAAFMGPNAEVLFGSNDRLVGFDGVGDTEFTYQVVQIAALPVAASR